MSGAHQFHTIEDVKRAHPAAFQAEGARAYHPLYGGRYLICSRPITTGVASINVFDVHEATTNGITRVASDFPRIGAARNAISRLLGSRR